MTDKPHPLQPLIVDEHGVRRFKANAIVRALLDAGALDMNKIAMLNFSREDREQFAQLIGYSHSGASELEYMSNETLTAAEYMDDGGENELQARNLYLRELLQEIREKLRDGVAALYSKHPNDLFEI